jgi:undecaprenyl-diphosphatase
MTVWQALFLGIVQGATEFLPVSSSGHLVLLPWLLGWSQAGDGNLAFDALVHWGTLLSVLIYFRDDIRRIVLAWWGDLRRRRVATSPESKLGWLLVVGSVPAALAGLLLEDWFESLFANPPAAGLALLVTASILVVAERVGSRSKGIGDAGWRDAVCIGLAQAVAIVPGISRSGATMSAGLLTGMQRDEAARFSFLLSVPVIAGAGAIQLVRVILEGGLSGQVGGLLAGFFGAGVVGYAAIHALLAFVRRRPLYLFAGYCALLGLFSVGWYALVR